MISLALRNELCLLCRSRRSRKSVSSQQAPCKWAPAAVLHPKTGEPFTPDGAWTFVADALEGGCEVWTTTLKKPLGKIGYYALLPGYGASTIYVKLQLVSGIVIGRSFHYSRN